MTELSAEEELNLSRSIFSNLRQYIIVLDKSRFITASYNIPTHILGQYEHEGFAGKHLSVFVNDPKFYFHEAFSLLNGSFDEVFTTGKTLEIEFSVKKSLFEAQVTKIEGERLLFQIENITNIITKQQRLILENYDETELIMATEGLTSWCFDVNSLKIITTSDNDIIERETSLEELLNRVGKTDQAKIMAMFDDIIQGRTTHVQISTSAFNKAHQLQRINIHAIPLYSDDGKVDTIIGYQKNITREYETTQKIEDSRIKLELALSSGNMIQWEYNILTQIFQTLTPVRVNKPSRTSHIHQYQIRSFLHPDDIQVYDDNFDNLISGKRSKANFNVRFLYNNKCYWININATIFKPEETDEILSIIGLTKDITKDVENTQELIRLRDRAEESNRLKSAFLANMSHEIRTPLNAIVGFSGLLANTNDEEERLEFIKLVEQNNELLLNLINDILDLSKIEAGKMEFSFSTFNVHQLMEQAFSNAVLKAKPNVNVILEDIDTRTMLTSDPTRLAQVINNFLTNAIKFTSHGEIRLGCTRKNNKLMFYVKDTGLGIKASEVNSVFDRFVKLNSYIPGTGLGLSICKTIIEYLGGEIGGESELGKGSTFWCTVPDCIPSN